MSEATARRQIGRTDVRVSRLGVGGGSLINAIGQDGVKQVLDYCWTAGLRHFDTAPFYLGGISETRFGDSLASRPRAEFVLSTKVGRTIRDGEQRFDYSAAATEASIEQSLHRLRLDRLDIVFIHDVTPALHGDQFESRFAEAVDGAGSVLTRLRAQGVIGAIGVGLADWEVALRFARTGLLDCVMLAGGYTLLQNRSAVDFLPYCATRDISVLVAAPFNTGILATGAVEGARFSYQPASLHIMQRTTALEAVCARHGVKLAAAALQFPLRHAAVASVVVGHQSAAEVRQNIEQIASPVPEAMWQELAALSLIPPDA